MFSFQISLKEVDDVKHFVSVTAQISCDVEIKAGPYLVDGKSIMGIFSLDRTSPVEVLVHGDQHTADSLKAAVGGF